jgi:ribonucleoside-diphosphate reductase alpha chain
LELTGIRRDVFLDRYALKDGEGKPVETSPEQMWDRVARAIAEVEAPDRRAEWEARFREALRDFRFVPGGRILAGAGTGQKVTFYNCLPPEQPVLTPDGYRPIAELDVRDAVITGRGRPRLVTHIFSREADEPLHLLVTSAGGRVRVTGEHPILARRRGGGDPDWFRAADLEPGDLVATLPGAGDTATGPWRVRRREPAGVGRAGPDGGLATLTRETEERYAFLGWSEIVERSSSPYRGTVYDLEVEEDHSFVTAGAIVSNCYVIPSPEDSRRGIMESVALMVEIMSRGGGVGVNLSTLRPRGSYVRGVNGTASGPVSWGEVYSTATGSVIQGGCFGPSVRIATDRGLIPAEELADRLERGERLHALTHEGPRALTWSFRNGIRPLLRVTTERGFQVEVTPDHRMGVLRGGRLTTVPMRELGEGDEVLVLLGEPWEGPEAELLPEPDGGPGGEAARFPERLDEDLAYLLGHLHAGGRVHPGRGSAAAIPRTLRLAAAGAEVRDRLLELSERLFGVRAAVEPGAAGSCELVIRSRALVAWLRRNGLLRARLAGARLPEPLLRSPSAVQGAFVAGCLDAGGADPDSEDGCAIEGLALGALRDLQRVLAANGVLARLTALGRPAGRRRAAYRLSVSGSEFRRRLAAFARRSLRMGDRGADAPTAWTGATPRFSYHRAPGRARGRRLATGTGRIATAVERVVRHATDRIASVEFAGMSPVYDFEVVGVHMLSGAGLYTSNSRRGALMLMLDDDHPDVEEFVTVKRDLTRINNANLSVCVSDGFMQAVREDGEWQLKWRGEVRRTLRARDLWNLICESAWASGEPGVVFMERYQKRSNTWYCEDIRCVNPCGEQGLGAWGVCNLGAVNLSAFARDGGVDWDGLRETVGTAVRFLDNVIDATEYYFPENERQQRYGIRRTGLGSMGLADLLIKLRIRYGSPEAVEFCDRLYRFIRDEAYRASALIAAEKGAFPAYEPEKYLEGHFIRQLPEDVRALIAAHGTRNGVLLTQAPTGTTSLVAGASSGIEPVYAFSFKRTDRTGTHIVYHSLYQEWIEAHPGEPVPDYFVTADELTPEEHVRMQAAIQQHVDSSISKTVNAPNSHTVEQVKTLYTLAYDLGCKGVTYFRDGCRAGVLSKLDDDKPQAQAQTAPQPEPSEELPLGRRVNGAWGRIRPIERPSRLEGFTERKETPVGTLFLTLNTLDDHPVELFAQIGKAGSDVSAFTEAVARLVSLALRSGVDPLEVANQLAGIGGSRSVGIGPGRVRSVPDAMGQFMREIWDELQKRQASRAKGEAERPEGGGRAPRSKKVGNGHNHNHGGAGGHGRGAEGGSAAAPQGPESAVAVEPLLEGNAVSFNLCPSCGLHTLAYMEGCALCFACGFSEC